VAGEYMLILYVAMKYDYGRPESGYSFEHYNFYDALHHMGHDLLYFDFMTLMQERGREWMNHLLLEIVRTEKPDLMFTVLFDNELDQKVIREISENTNTLTINWFCDDHWRFDNFTIRWAPCFNWSVTTAESAFPKYARIGYRSVIKSQWACNPFLYRKLALPQNYDVTFVGKAHGSRSQVIRRLQEAGIKVDVWGSGWESGRLSQEEMIRVFNESRINLNLSNASTPVYCRPQSLLQRNIKRLFSMTRDSLFKTAVSARADNENQHYPEQIKGRNFEVPGCGGFLLTGKAENLEAYYEIDKEVACFDDMDDLIKKVKYYLCDEKLRETIAARGYQRTLDEHTYVHRFTEIFQRLGLLSGSLQSAFNQNVRPGVTEEIR
jgi:spore maturation protein CgeB